jgi:hypothetical protein
MSGSYFRELRNNFLGEKLKFFDPEIFLTLDLGARIRDGKIRIRDQG